jgi:putative alpha-1,2-mannosidase
MSPTKYSEPVDGAYVGLDQNVHYPSPAADAGNGNGNGNSDDGGDSVRDGGSSMKKQHTRTHAYYSDLSLWDTFRTTLPWQLLTRRDVSANILWSLEQMTTAQEGVFPRWPLGSVETGCMIGSHGSSFVYDAVLRGLNSKDVFNLTVITEALLKQTTFIPDENTDPESIPYLLARSDVQHYLEEGYVSLEASPLYERDGEPASLTLSYAYDDYVLGNLCEAEAASHPSRSKSGGTTDACESVKARGGNYKHLWSAADAIMCPRSGQTGALSCPADPAALEAWGMWTEGDAYQWSYFGKKYW